MEMTPADVIRDALDVLHEKGWHKGGMEGPDGSVCLVGAQRAVFSWLGYGALFAAARRLYPDREICNDGCLACFNDHPDTTFEDIELVAKHAINDLELGEV